MNTLTKLALGMIGQLKDRPLQAESTTSVTLPAPATTGGMPLMQALQARQSRREFATTALEMQTLSELLWAGAGINRPELGGRTAPSALNAQEVDLHVALPTGLYRYDPVAHALRLGVARDVRRVTGYQDFTDEAALDLIFVADHRKMKRVPAAQRAAYAYTAAGAMAQNVYLFCASQGLATVIRAWMDRDALARAMDLEADHQVLLAQTVGFAKG
mgnify:CR=1 FL=1